MQVTPTAQSAPLPGSVRGSRWPAAFRTTDGAAIACVVIALVTMLHVALRASGLSITHDEALTYGWHVAGRWGDILRFSTPGLPDNNHLLYTLLAKATTSWLGVSEFALRLPSLLGCALYLIGAFAATRVVATGVPRVIGMAALCANPYVIDFLGLARGYGLGLGFMMIGVATLLSLGSAPMPASSRKPAVSLLCFALAALSNLTFLLSYIAATAVLGALLLAGMHVTGRRAPAAAPVLRRFAVQALPSLTLLGLLAVPLRELRKENLFGIGGRDGFWVDSVGGLVAASLYEPALVEAWRGAALVAVTIACALVAVVILRTSRSPRSRGYALESLAALLLLAAVGSVLQHHLFGVAYLTDRRAIFFLPLFFLCLAGATHRSFMHDALGKSVGFALLAIQVALMTLFLAAGNRTHTRDWRYDAATRSAMEALRGWLDESRRVEPLAMEGTWFLTPAVNFYRDTLGMAERIPHVSRDPIKGDGAIYYVTEEESAKVPPAAGHVLFASSRSGTRLMVGATPRQ